jgi:hypothetical protein
MYVDLLTTHSIQHCSRGSQTQAVAELLKDPKSHLLAIGQGACVLGIGVVGSFMPTFISGFGFSAGTYHVVSHFMIH